MGRKMSNSSKRKLKKARAQLHETNNLLKVYKAHVAGDGKALVNYVQGLSAFGEFALECMVAQSPERSFLVWEALRAWAMSAGMLRKAPDGTLELTHVCKEVDFGSLSAK